MKYLAFSFFVLWLGAPAFAQSAGLAFHVSCADAEQAVSHALADAGAGEKISATMSARRNEPVFKHSQPVSVKVRGLTFDKQAGRWSGSLLFLSGDEVVSALPAAGLFNEMVEIPVLKREVRHGEVITSAEVELRDYPLNRTRHDTVSDLSSLIGHAPLRTISANRPIRVHEIKAAAIVKKNSLLQMRYRMPGIEITTMGQALEDGGKDEVIALRNLDSKKTVRAVVLDEKTVEILSGATQSAQAERGSYGTN